MIRTVFLLIGLALKIDHCELVVAHPAHELLVYGFLESHHPSVHVLTDGSGRNAQPRIDSTAKVLRKTQCRPGAVFGSLSDRVVYNALLTKDFGHFIHAAKVLAQSFVQSECRFVIGDAAEGKILTHDVCRAVINTAVRIATDTTGRTITNLEFNVIGGPFRDPSDAEQTHSLSESCFQRKLATSLEYSEVQREVAEFISAYGADSLRTEQFRSASDPNRHDSLIGRLDYEKHAMDLVQSGVYDKPVLFDEHVAPLFGELRQLAESFELSSTFA